ncbi:hypothetical protein NHF48_017530 [Sphingomonas sp. H160509]|uniref:hypothetical protein n=1 Tax=Sphingomonas sp. H160509 TaxID=2955313 RepID=UPI002097C402|nr:hypothetical protein [Sphingomonas sp. H160509]MDD1452314.1 hypothetical protein [Sphingomonas sp. H160509]
MNLTVASVPMVIRLESIRAEQLCTWDGKFAAEVLGGKVSLAKWLRFEDQPYLPSAFDRVIQETRRDRAEYGFSHLRLVVAYLHWHNLEGVAGRAHPVAVAVAAGRGRQAEGRARSIFVADCRHRG